MTIMSIKNVYFFDVFYLSFKLTLFPRFDILKVVNRTIKENRRIIVIQIQQSNPPLELPLSCNDLFDVIRRPQISIRNKDIKYSYSEYLTLKEPIGIHLELDTLIYYPSLCKALRQLEALSYEIEIPLHDIPTLKNQGLDAISKTLDAIKEKLSTARQNKACLDAKVNNLVYLYGQEEKMPVLRDFKPYFTRRQAYYGNKLTIARKLNISGVNYYLRYQGERYGKTSHLYKLDEYHLLKKYFEATKSDDKAITPRMRYHLIGGFINTPIFAFRAANEYKQSGKKYYIDLKTNITMTRVSEARNIACLYQPEPELILLERKK